MRGFRDRDYVETVEGLFFTVVSNVHPEGRVIAYLKYAPSPEGKWGAEGSRYARMMPYYDIPSLLNTIEFLKRHYPHYVYNCPVMGIKMSAVPLSHVKHHYRPEERLANLKLEGARDSLEALTLELADYIASQAGIPVSSLGVTGSVLIGIHRPEFSDVDLVVYGRSNALKVRRALKELYSSPSSEVRRVEGAKLEELVKRRIEIFHLSREEALKITMRKWNRGVFRGRDFSIHPVKVEDEVDERYGDRVFKAVGLTEVEAVVEDSSEALFMPAVYKVRDVEVLWGPRVDEVREVVSYEGLYLDIAEPGEKVRVRGKLELVEGKKGGYYRVLVGSPEARGMDYLKPLT